jgi:MFS family permease
MIISIFSWLGYFQQGEVKTSWIGSIFYAMPLLSGPIMANFVDRFGCKRMTAVGGVISCFGFILSSFCSSVEELYLTIGVIGGSGLSAAYVVGLVTVERWFKKHRSLAIGIVSAGTGFGTFILPQITQSFLNAFDWQTTIIGLSLFLILMPIIAVFLDDPPKLECVEDSGKLAKNTSTFFDTSLITDKSFAFLSIATFMVYAFFNTAIYFLPELLKNSDYESGNFIAWIGITLMFGMIFLGWCADQHDVNVVWLTCVCVVGEFENGRAFRSLQISFFSSLRALRSFDAIRLPQ